MYGYALGDPVNRIDPKGLQEYLKSESFPAQREQAAIEETLGPIQTFMNPASDLTPVDIAGVVAERSGVGEAGNSFISFCRQILPDQTDLLPELFETVLGRYRTRRQNFTPVPENPSGQGVSREYLMPTGRGPVLRGRKD